MKRSFTHPGFLVYVLILSFLLSSCITYRFIGNEETLKMERGLQGERTGRVIGNSFLIAVFSFVSVITGSDLVGAFLPDQKLRHLTLTNTGPDTLQVNMLAGETRKDSQFCDFRDIRIPPGEKCRLLVPDNTAYNLYFSNTFNSEEDDELLEINTQSHPKLKLRSGMTHQKDSISNY